VGIRATPIAEAMLALVLMDHYLRFRARSGADVVFGHARHHPMIARSHCRASQSSAWSSLIGAAVIDELRARKLAVAELHASMMNASVGNAGQR